MKKIILYLLLIILLVFTIPLFFTKRIDIVETSTIEESIDDTIIVENNEKKIIRLLHNETMQVEEVDLEKYLVNVVSAEMPVTYEMEALKAQAIVARTYTLYKMKNGSKHEGADVCDSAACCQAWISKENRLARWEEKLKESNWAKIEEAVYGTKGKYVIYNGEPINAFFHSNSGGMTEIPSNVWGGSFEYLQTVETSGEEEYSGYSSEVTVTKDELIQKMLEEYSDFQINFEEENCIQILELNESKRVKKIKIGNKELSGVETRTIFGLKSANFSFEIKDDNIKFFVIGYGHGVGLSQSGSDSLAKKGYDYISIIKHYYKNVEISE